MHLQTYGTGTMPTTAKKCQQPQPSGSMEYPVFDPAMFHAWFYGCYAHPQFLHAVYSASHAAAVAAHAAALAASASDYDQQPRSKRRKLPYGSANASTASGGGDNLDYTMLRRGDVTFKPYSDDLDKQGRPRKGPRGATTSVSGYQLPQKRCHKESNRSTGISNLRRFRMGDGNEMRTMSEMEDEETERHSRTTVGNLFPEILEMILCQLDVKSKGRAARVCNRWRDAGNCKSVWKGVEARLHLSGRSNPHLYPSLVRRGIKKVQVLSLRKSLRELVNGIPSLESLNLSGCYNLSDLALDGAFNKELPSLKVLNLSLCKDVSDGSLGRIATHCKNLRSLNLGGCAKITDQGLMYVSWGLKKIEQLNLRSCRLVSDHGIGHLAGQDANGNYTSPPSTIKYFGLQDCQKLSDDSLKHISVGMPELNRINLSFCVSVTDTGLKSLARLSHLEDLNLRSCDNVSDIGLGFLSEDSPASSRLRLLDVSFCSNVSDAGMRHVSAGMSGLKSLSMTTCAISDAGLERLANGKAGALLEILNVGQCVTLTDAGLKSVGDKMKSLRVLDLYGCPKISLSAIAKTRKAIKGLKRLNRAL